MKTDEAKFILSSTHPADRSSDDPVVAEAMEHASRDAMLASWLEQETAFDDAIAKKFAQTAPPPNLLDEILTGAAASREAPRNAPARRFALPVWLSFAASVALLVGILLFKPGHLASLDSSELAAFAAHNLSTAQHDHAEATAASLALEAALSEGYGPLVGNLGLSPAQMAEANCRNLAWEGRNVYEVCFLRDGVYYHAYVTTADRAAAQAARSRAASDPLLQEFNGIATATWIEGESLVTLAMRGDLATLERVL
jgi:hypothetical protein